MRREHGRRGPVDNDDLDPARQPRQVRGQLGSRLVRAKREHVAQHATFLPASCAGRHVCESLASGYRALVIEPLVALSGRRAPILPRPRGPVSDAVLSALRRRPGPVAMPRLAGIDMLDDDDAQLALSCCYELHYRGFAGVDPEWEWAPSLLTVRRRLERRFEERVADEAGPAVPTAARDVVDLLVDLSTGDGDESLSSWMVEEGTRRHLREFCVHRSAYQRKEADPHTWAIPRLRGRAKATMATIQYDEYGAGDPAEAHAELFATMRSLGLDDMYGAYLDLLPGSTLATDNIVSLFGLHRRLRGACVGHLALF